jgi:hypothetical protein
MQSKLGFLKKNLAMGPAPPPVRASVLARSGPRLEGVEED